MNNECFQKSWDIIICYIFRAKQEEKRKKEEEKRQKDEEKRLKEEEKKKEEEEKVCTIYKAFIKKIFICSYCPTYPLKMSPIQNNDVILKTYFFIFMILTI